VAVDERPPPSTTLAWDAVRDRLRGATEPLLLDARVYALPSPRLPVHAEVAAHARASFPARRPVAEAALDLCGRIHRDFRYVAGSSTVGSTVPELLARGSGVCQDFAHLAVAGCGRWGWPRATSAATWRPHPRRDDRGWSAWTPRTRGTCRR
jgi:transglutaminase-like putative cysteine protease